MASDLSKYSIDELRTMFVDQGQQLGVLAESRREIQEEVNRRVAAAGAKAKVDQMEPQERDALMVYLKGDDPLKPIELAEVKA